MSSYHIFCLPNRPTKVFFKFFSPIAYTNTKKQNNFWPILIDYTHLLKFLLSSSTFLIFHGLQILSSSLHIFMALSLLPPPPPLVLL